MTIDSVETEPTEDPAEDESAAAAERLVQLLSPERVDALLADAEATGLAIDGPDGLIDQMIRAVLEPTTSAMTGGTRPGPGRATPATGSPRRR
jgi:hypothetical protein